MDPTPRPPQRRRRHEVTVNTEAVRAARHRLYERDPNVTVQHIADMIGCSRGHVYAVEAGRACSLALLSRLAAVYGIAVATLVAQPPQAVIFSPDDAP